MNESQLGESCKNMGDKSQKYMQLKEMMVTQNCRVAQCGSHKNVVAKTSCEIESRKMSHEKMSHESRS